MVQGMYKGCDNLVQYLLKNKVNSVAVSSKSFCMLLLMRFCMLLMIVCCPKTFLCCYWVYDAILVEIDFICFYWWLYAATVVDVLSIVCCYWLYASIEPIMCYLKGTLDFSLACVAFFDAELAWCSDTICLFWDFVFLRP